jgi:hypothetical protein
MKEGVEEVGRPSSVKITFQNALAAIGAGLIAATIVTLIGAGASVFFALTSSGDPRLPNAGTAFSGVFGGLLCFGFPIAIVVFALLQRTRLKVEEPPTTTDDRI